MMVTAIVADNNDLISTSSVAAALSVVSVVGAGTALVWGATSALRLSSSARDAAARSTKADDDFVNALAAARADKRDEEEGEALLLSKTWASVHERLNKYHNEAQAQGRTAFVLAIIAMSVGMVFLAGGAALALAAPTTVSATIVGTLGGLSALISGYVSRTFLRTYQNAAGHLRGYFTQPVEASRFLFAERAIAMSGLPADRQAELMHDLVKAMVTGAFDPTRPEPEVQ